MVSKKMRGIVMSKELCNLIEQISKEKGISRDALLKVLESALTTAAKKRYNHKPNIFLRIDPKTCTIKAFEIMTVVPVVNNIHEEVGVEEIRHIFPDKTVGDKVELPVDIGDFGRIAAQTAKQIFFQKVREVEKDVIFDVFKDKVGQITTAIISRKEKGNYFADIKNIEAVLPLREALANDNLKRGDIVKAYIADVRKTQRAPLILLSRTCPEFVAGLLKMEVPEINDKIVEIKGIAREPSERTKIAVFSHDPSIDPVGACVGMKGTRIQSIVRELRGERIDIIAWSSDPRIYIARALTPASVNMVGVNEDEKTAMVVVNDEQLSIAIGKRGQNIKLATKLTGWEIDILSEIEYSKIRADEPEKLQIKRDIEKIKED